MLKFYQCETCGNLIVMIEDNGPTPICCGEEMTPLRPAATDGAIEKHVPVINYYRINEETTAAHVAVGSLPHPAEDYHRIAWIALETNKGFSIHTLLPGEAPHTVFILADDEHVINAYAYCNLHGLWIG